MDPKNYQNQDPRCGEGIKNSLGNIITKSPPDHAILNKDNYCYRLVIGELTASEPRSNEKGLFTLIAIAINQGAKTFEII